MPNDLINPYIAGAPVTEVRMFFGREDVFDWIQNSLTGQYTDHMLVIHGQRRVGKTSVLKQLGNRLPEKYIPVFFDLQGRTHTTIDRFLWWLARETVRVLKQERNIEVPIPVKDDFSKDPDFFENTFLPSLRPALGDKVLLFTFDEFDNLEESEIKEELARPLIDHLRRLMGREDMSFIFSIGSSGRKLENMQADYTEFFKTALYKKISFLSEEQTRELIIRPVDGLLEYDRAAIKHIYELASGHPYFTQLTCHELFAHCQRTDQRRINDDDVKAILDDVVERGTVNLKFTWDEASDIEKWSLAALSQLDKTDNRTLLNYLTKQHIRFSEADFNSGLLHLREKDILTAQNRFVIYLLKIWLQKNRPMEQVREELTEVNPIANRYIEIGLEYKDGGMYDKALDSFREALAIAPGNIQSQTHIALTYMVQNSFSKAVEEFEKVLLIDDEDVVARGGLCDAHLALGDTAMSSGHIKEAILSYERVLRINQEHLEARQRMADISQKQAEKALSNGKDEEALNLFSEALKYSPEDPSLIKRVETVRAEKKAKVLASFITRADKESGSKNWDKAILYLNEAKVLSPQNQVILSKIEDIKIRQIQERLDVLRIKADKAEKAGRWDAAISALGDYLSLRPGDKTIQERHSKLLDTQRDAWLTAVVTRTKQAMAAEKWNEAVTALNEVLSLEPENQEFQLKVTEVRAAQQKARQDAVLKKVDAALQAKNWDEAVSALNEGLSFEPDNIDLKIKLSEVRDARRASRLQATLRLVDSSIAAGKWDIAIHALNEILLVEPENAAIQQRLIEVQSQQRENKFNTLWNLAKSYTKAEKFDHALSIWEEILGLQPEDVNQVQHEIENVKKLKSLAKVYLEAKDTFNKKNYEKTISLLKTIIEYDVDYKDATLLFAQAIELRGEHKWWQTKRLKITGAVVSLALLGWIIIAFGLPAILSLENSSVVTTDLAEIPTAGWVATKIESAVLIENTPAPTAKPIDQPYTWERVNSGQFLPRDQITVIIADPNDRGVIYVGTKNSGVYKTIDGGISWQPSLQGLGRAYITSMIIDPNNSVILYASVDIGGLYKSINGGEEWYPINTGIQLPGGQEYSQIVMDPQNSQHLFFTQRQNVYQTHDGGISWQEIKLPTCVDEISNLAIHPNDGNTIYLTEMIGNRDERLCPAGIYKSTNAGELWSIIPMDASLNNIEFAFGSLKLNPYNPETMYVSTYQNLYGSFDNGENWKILLNTHCAEIAFDDENEYCSGYDQIWLSKNSGQNWSIFTVTK